MPKTRLSFVYLFGYLIPSGLALLLAPQLTLRLLFSNGSYGDVMPRLVGMFVLVLGLLVVQIVRRRIEAMYTTLLAVRVLILVVLLGLYFYSHDLLFIALFSVVGFGVVLTSIAYWLDRQTKIGPQRKAA